MQYIFSPEYEKTDIGDHIFPLVKYRLIKERLIEHNLAEEKDFIHPAKAAVNNVLLVHTKTYVDKLRQGKLSVMEQMQLELPYSKSLVESSLICVNGTVHASEIALSCRVGIHLGGGFHHAYPDHGEGFCVFNDVAVAVQKLISTKRVHNVLVIDCDLHQGNGTAFIFKDNNNVFTFSIHQEYLYPYPKEKGSLDIGLDNGTDDTTYNKLLKENLLKIRKIFKPDIIFYVAGADPFEGDQLSGLQVSINGLEQRDEIVMDTVNHFNVPLVVTLAGGYAPDINDTVTIHYNTCCASAIL